MPDIGGNGLRDGVGVQFACGFWPAASAFTAFRAALASSRSGSNPCNARELHNVQSGQ